MIRTIHATILSVIIFAGISKSWASCPENTENFRNSTIQVGTLSPRGECFFQISPHNYVNLTYRSYLLSSNGYLMIFLSLGPGDPSTDTGAREFFWPTLQNARLSYTKVGRYVDVVQGSSLTYRFDGDTGQLVSMRGATVQVNSKFSEKNKGGVEIVSSSHLYLDSGFKIGSSPSGHFERRSEFTDRFGEKCVVKNEEVFQRVDNGDVQFKYSGKTFMDWLNLRCPVLRK